MLVYRRFEKTSSHPDQHLRVKEVHLCLIQVTSTLLPVLSPFHRLWIAKGNMSDHRQSLRRIHLKTNRRTTNPASCYPKMKTPGATQKGRMYKWWWPNSKLGKMHLACVLPFSMLAKSHSVWPWRELESKISFVWAQLRGSKRFWPHIPYVLKWNRYLGWFVLVAECLWSHTCCLLAWKEAQLFQHALLYSPCQTAGNALISTSALHWSPTLQSLEPATTISTMGKHQWHGLSWHGCWFMTAMVKHALSISCVLSSDCPV